MIPGRNNLALAMSVLTPQTAALSRFADRVANAAGQQVASYAPPVTITGGSIQPVPAARYEQLGLDRKKRYVQWWAPTSIFGVARLRAPDRFTWNGAGYEVTQEDDWHVQDGWVRVVAVRLDGQAG